jgi:CDP-diacylglycerol--glycerol-3-phosphate 3-phosphatidyltransferase
MKEMRAQQLLNLPNKLTFIRVLIVPVLVVVLLTKLNDWLALAIFLAAALTDFIDGYLARSRKQVTILGKLMDPIADKLLIGGSLISLVEIDRAPAYLVVIIVGREFAVNGLRAVAASQNIIIPAGRLGKMKMTAQVVAISFLILHIPIYEINFGTFAYEVTLGYLMLWLAAILTLWSGIHYYIEGLKRIDISL